MYKSEDKQECLATNIRLFCSTNNLTLTDFAALASISEATMNNWLRGASIPDLQRQEALEKVFGAKFDKICSSVVTARLLIDKSLTIEDVFPYNCIISAAFCCAGTTDYIRRYECSDDDFDFSYRQIAPAVWDQIFSELNYREQQVIEMRYRDSLLLSEIGTKTDLCTERVRQIEKKALRKINLAVNKYLHQVRTDLKDLQNENAELRQYIAVLEATRSDLPEVRPDSLPVKFDTVVEDLDFSIRTYNCLKRAQLNTVQDILDYDKGFHRMRNMGIRSIQEVADTINALGIGYHYDFDKNKFVKG